MKVPTKTGYAGSWVHNNQIAGLIFISPWLIGFLGFVLVPMLMSMYLSFTSYNIISPPVWVGLDNLNRMLFGDKTLWASLGVTFYYVLIAVPLKLAAALGIAVLLSRKHSLISFYRTLYYIPSVLGGSVAVSIVWRMIFGGRGPFGALAQLLTSQTYSLVGDPDRAIYTIILLSTWQFGSSMLIFLAGIKNISSVYYEAAVVDGAGPFRKFFHITLPLLSPVLLFNLIMQTIGGFKIFSQAYVITDGGPMDRTLVYALYMFRRAFTYYEMGYASAMAWLLLLIIAVFTAAFFASSDRWVFYEGGAKK